MQKTFDSSVVPRLATLTLLVLLGALAGCGQKGPLFPAAAGPAAAPASAPAR